MALCHLQSAWSLLQKYCEPFEVTSVSDNVDGADRVLSGLARFANEFTHVLAQPLAAASLASENALMLLEADKPDLEQVRQKLALAVACLDRAGGLLQDMQALAARLSRPGTGIALSSTLSRNPQPPVANFD
jgi:C4-dicarboxylate-specific signal transduction histidine kinase